MKTLHRLLTVIACLVVAMQAQAAVELANGVTYTRGAEPVEGCSWQTTMASAAMSKSKNSVVTSSAAAASFAMPQLSLEVSQLNISPGARKNAYWLVVRANVFHEGKLIATRDFQEQDTAAKEKPACEVLRTVGASLGENIADWVSATQFMECGADCAGIHPDEVIVVGSEALLESPDSINATVRDSCRVQTAAISKLLAAYNEEDPAPRARLQSRPIDIEKYPGRRLVLRLNRVHAIGGGGLSGPKWMSASGELWDGKSLVASFESHTHTLAGLTTCRSVDSMNDDTAKMIASWLRSPTLEAKLK